MQLIIASTNSHKIREFKTLLKGFKSLDLRTLKDFPNYTPPSEKGTTFEENAKIKAVSAASALGSLVISDDSGLVVPALGGEPGIKSSCYAGEYASESENREKLIQKLRHLPEEKRSAYFECCLVLAGPDGIKKVAKGFCEGTLTVEPRGSYGFSYDSLFIKHDYRKTFAEIEDETRIKISYRIKAFDKIRLSLESLFL